MLNDNLKYADDYIKSNGYKFPSIERKQLEPFILNLLDFEVVSQINYK